ncbi:hypothetical protein OWR28_12260 [Chryseobacterium sp. 1B4]
MKKLFLGLALTAGVLAFAQETETKTETKTVTASPLKKMFNRLDSGSRQGKFILFQPAEIRDQLSAIRFPRRCIR